MIPVTKIYKGERTVHHDKKSGPLFVWNVTAKCNLRCSHCYRDSEPGAEDAGLPDEKILSLVDEIKALNPPIVLLTGGEPLLRKNIFDIINKCRSTGLRVGLSTNGTLIDRNMARKINEAGVDYVGISIDGSEDLHDKFRGKKGAFNASWQGIKLLNELGTKTGVRFTLTKENGPDLMAILDKALKAGTKRFCLYHLVYAGRAQKDLDMTIADKRACMDRFFKRVKELSKSAPDFEVLTTDSPADGIFMSLGKDTTDAALSCIMSHGGCSAGERVVYLDSTGDLYPCQFLREVPLGNVKETPLAQIWQNKADRFLNELRSKKELLKGKCSSCAHKAICGGCRARAKAYFGSLWDEDPACYLAESEMKNAIIFKAS